MFLRFAEFTSIESTSDTGPTRPMNIVIISSIRPGVPEISVIPAESHEVENADKASNRHCTPRPSSGSVKYSTEKQRITAVSESSVTVSVR